MNLQMAPQPRIQRPTRVLRFLVAAILIVAAASDSIVVDARPAAADIPPETGSAQDASALAPRQTEPGDSRPVGLMIAIVVALASGTVLAAIHAFRGGGLPDDPLQWG